MEKCRHIFGLGIGGILLLALGWIASTGCVDMSSSSDSGGTRTNNYEASTPVYRVDTPTMTELAGVFKSQDRNYHESTITVFADGEFLWNSRTDMLQMFRGQIYDLNDSGFSVKLSDGSGAFMFQFSPDKRSFFSLDPNGQTVEEYRK